MGGVILSIFLQHRVNLYLDGAASVCAGCASTCFPPGACTAAENSGDADVLLIIFSILSLLLIILMTLTFLEGSFCCGCEQVSPMGTCLFSCRYGENGSVAAGSSSELSDALERVLSLSAREQQLVLGAQREDAVAGPAMAQARAIGVQQVPCCLATRCFQLG